MTHEELHKRTVKRKPEPGKMRRIESAVVVIIIRCDDPGLPYNPSPYIWRYLVT